MIKAKQSEKKNLKIEKQAKSKYKAQLKTYKVIRKSTKGNFVKITLLCDTSPTALKKSYKGKSFTIN